MVATSESEPAIWGSSRSSSSSSFTGSSQPNGCHLCPLQYKRDTFESWSICALWWALLLKGDFQYPIPYPLARFIFLLREISWGLSLKLNSELYSNLSKAEKRVRSKQPFSQIPAEPLPLPIWRTAHLPTSYLAAADSSQTSAPSSKTESHNPILAFGDRFSGDSLSACLFWLDPTPAAPQLVWGNKLQ